MSVARSAWPLTARDSKSEVMNMACHELAGLRLGLMNVLGIDDESERQHELAEIGDAATEPGAVRGLLEAQNLQVLHQAFDAAVGELEARVGRMGADAPELSYHRTLLVLSKKVELELGRHVANLTELYRELEEVHDFVHELYPSN
jgi:hypothetical protein